MRVEVKLYSYHDIDLVSLYKTGQVLFPETTKQVLNSYARKEVYRIQLLEPNQHKISKYPSENYRKFYHYHILLNEKSDADAIKLLKSITPGFRNNFIKAILRQYLCGAFGPEYSVNGDTELFNTMSAMFQGARKEERIGRKTDIRKQKANYDRQKYTIDVNRPGDARAQTQSYQVSDTQSHIASQSSHDNNHGSSLLHVDNKKALKIDAKKTNKPESANVEKHQSENATNMKSTPKTSSKNDNETGNNKEQKPQLNKNKFNSHTDQSSYQNRQMPAVNNVNTTGNKSESGASKRLLEDFDDFLMETTEQY